MAPKRPWEVGALAGGGGVGSALKGVQLARWIPGFVPTRVRHFLPSLSGRLSMICCNRLNPRGFCKINKDLSYIILMFSVYGVRSDRKLISLYENATVSFPASIFDFSHSRGPIVCAHLCF